MIQLQLFEAPPEAPSIGRSETYRKEIMKLMSDGKWRTKYAIHQVVGGDISSVTSRLRDFRIEKFGGHTVNIRPKSKGVFEYQLILKK